MAPRSSSLATTRATRAEPGARILNFLDHARGFLPAGPPTPRVMEASFGAARLAAPRACGVESSRPLRHQGSRGIDHDQGIRRNHYCRPVVGFAHIGSNDLSDRPRRNSRRRPIRLQGRVSRSRRPGKTDSDGQRDGLFRRVRPEWKLRRSRRRQGPVGADPAQCRLVQARQCHGRGQRRHAQPQCGVDGLRHRSAQGEERDPVYRRRVVARPPGRRAHPFQGDRGGQEPRQARHRRHAAYGAGGHRRLRFDHHQFGEFGQRLRHRPQVRRQRDGRLCRPHRKPVR